MSKVYLPTAEQFDITLGHLSKIAGVMSSKIDVSNWKGIQTAVKAGLAPTLFPVGTQFTVSHSEYGDMSYDVVAHDYYKSVNDANAHTMTLQCHDLLPNIMQVDNSEAFYYAEQALPAGTYNFTLTGGYNSWTAGTYQFTLTQTLPKGGQLFLNGSPSAALTTSQVNVYASAMTRTVTEKVSLSEGKSGTHLGTFGTELNSIGRCAYGSSNYKESAIRQFLNSDAAEGSVWSPQTKFDRPPSWVSACAGFMNGLDGEFLSIIGEVIVPCSTNNLYESPDSSVTAGSVYTVNDRFYIASLREITGATGNSIYDGSELFPFYKGATDADLIKERYWVPTNWRLRTPSIDGVSSMYRILNDGKASASGASDAFGIAPVCTIV